ncbi:MAG: PhnD/SsuA/transferrin family substrate-binding protein [Nitratireductor sp.]|nr:PhnD/SsuA/transferrin family substrate-binding protein [Nitratireductor sp.]
MPAPFAALPMYDWPEVSPAWDRLWALIRPALAARGIEAEPELRRNPDHESQWTDPGLLVGQTCGWPFVSRLREKVVPFARFDFGLGGRPGDYHSVYITSGEADPGELIRDPSAIIAVNSFDSQSGFRALHELVGEPLGVPESRFLVTGGHRNSIRKVAAGKAQLAAIDAQSWRLALAHEPAAANVRVEGRSSDVPGLPLITAPAFASSSGDLFSSVSSAAGELADDVRRALGILGVVTAKAEDYAVLTSPPFGMLSVIP